MTSLMRVSIVSSEVRELPLLRISAIIVTTSLRPLLSNFFFHISLMRALLMPSRKKLR